MCTVKPRRATRRPRTARTTGRRAIALTPREHDPLHCARGRRLAAMSHAVCAWPGARVLGVDMDWYDHEKDK